MNLANRKVILCGRTLAFDQADQQYTQLEHEAFDQSKTINDQVALIQILARSQKGITPRTLQAVVRKIFARKEVEKTCTNLRQKGIDVEYITLDLISADAATKLTEIERQYGDITELIHGAGMIEDRLFSQKSWESFRTVYMVKVHSLTLLLTKLKQVNHITMFSSVAAAFGNRGQVDYATANSTLDALIQPLTNQGVRARSIQWGPWGGAGMVTPELSRAYQKAGIRVLTISEGTNAFLEEHTNTGQVAVRSWPFE